MHQMNSKVSMLHRVGYMSMREWGDPHRKSQQSAPNGGHVVMVTQHPKGDVGHGAERNRALNFTAS